MKRWLNRSVLRAVAIAAITWLVVSTVLVPQYNPFTRASMQAVEQSGLVWNDINYWRVALSMAVGEQDRWPANIQAHAPTEGIRVLQVTSPEPYVLHMRIDDRPDLGTLAGKRLTLQMGAAPERRWTCLQGTPPVPPRLLPLNCEGNPGEPERDPFGWLKTLLWLCAAVLVVSAAVWLLRHPLIGPAQLRPARLRRTPIDRLPALDKLLRWTGRRTATLATAAIRQADWHRAVQYPADPPAVQIQALAERVSARSQPLKDWPLPGEVFSWQFPPSLPVALDRCIVCMPPPGMSAAALVQQLRALPAGSDVVLVIGTHDPEAPQGELERHTQDRANLHVLIDSPTQTEWLLKPDATPVLLRLLTAQLRVTRISPYQTRGGVTREDAFFGRDQLLARILSREPANYLVVGGRQLGKSSLLKALQRRLAGHPSIVCHYVSLRDHRLAPRLATQLGLDVDTPLDSVIAHIQSQECGKRMYLLVDEADQFFRDQSRTHYAQLSALRALSDEGRCCFILAGFWDLYEAAVIDYQSPLRNFGEVLTIGGLEHNACMPLATQPLRRLRLGFAQDSLAERLVEASRHRATLVSILCQECLEALQPGERVIEARHLSRALASQAVQDTLAGWSRLSADPEACRLDRIAVYHTARAGHTSLAELSALLEQRGIHGQASALQASLQRLQLAYVLQRQGSGSGFGFAVPLFHSQLEPGEVEVLLTQELQALRSAPPKSTATPLPGPPGPA